jgi:hypothetical protein
MKRVGEKRLHSEQTRKGRDRFRFVRRIAGYVAAAFIAFSPILELPAKAEKPPASQPASQPTSMPKVIKKIDVCKIGGDAVPNCLVKGDEIEIKDTNGESLQVFAVHKEKKLVPSLAVIGPGLLRLKFYPVMTLERFENIDSVIPISVGYSISKNGDKLEKTQQGNTRISNFRSRLVRHTTRTIGTPIELEIKVASGKHTVSVVSPSGLLEIADFRQINNEPLKAEKSKSEIKRKPGPAPKKEESRFTLFALDAGSTFLHDIGPGKNSGDFNQLLATINIPLSNMFAFNTGVFLSSFGLIQNTKEARTDLRSLSANAVAGVVLSSGKHSAFAGTFGGYRLMRRQISSDIYKGEDTDLTHGYELGGHAGYSYGHAIEMMLSGSNNPFNPLSARVHGIIPYAWVKGAYPSVEADVHWLHTLKSIEEANRVGGVSLDRKNVFAHLSGKVPIWRFGPFIPSLLVAGDLNASEEGFHHADLQLGLSALFELNRLMIEAGGAVSPITLTPYFRAKMRIK